MTVTELDERLKKVAVIGAAGKMGSGIALLLLQEMARGAAEKQGCISPDACSLVLVDSNQEGLSKLKSYLRSNLIKYAEKNINALRGYYEKDISLISNEEIIQAFVQGALDSIIMGTDPGLAKNALMVFEAIIEDFEIKSEFFRTLQQISLVEQWYFTNTSSIPIDTLAKSAGLDSKLIGYHFYNPPAVQKLLEVVAPSTIDPQLEDAALELAKRLQKVLVRSNDVAGFIGNGHFIREVVFALQQSKELSEKYKISFEDAATIINTITQKYLLRPMGIFQLVDYVGVDVCANIMQVMSKYLSNSEIQDPLLNKMVQAGVKGGHHPDGTQKNGFFSYKNNMIQAVYSLNKKEEARRKKLDNY